MPEVLTSLRQPEERAPISLRHTLSDTSYETKVPSTPHQFDGEDLNLVEFRSFEYQQSKQVVVGEDIRAEILKTGIRKLERGTGVSHHTLERILRGEPVRQQLGVVASSAILPR